MKTPGLATARRLLVLSVAALTIVVPTRLYADEPNASDTNSKEPKIVDDQQLPQIRLTTSKGDVLIELYEDEAPNTVANFISLVEKGYYDGLKFHRVIEDFMAQGGCPQGTGTGGPGYSIPCECGRKDHRKHERGTLSMAHRGKDTGGSQFFITFVATPHLDGKHTVFGQVIEGMENVDNLNRTEKRQPTDVIKPADVITKATVVQKRNHDYVPKKVP